MTRVHQRGLVGFGICDIHCKWVLSFFHTKNIGVVIGQWASVGLIHFACSILSRTFWHSIHSSWFMWYGWLGFRRGFEGSSSIAKSISSPHTSGRVVAAFSESNMSR
jgi:hypothetical protein